MAVPTLAQRRSRKREDARRTILEATEEILVEGGAEALSIRRLAERCGCTAPTIYHYFGDKQGLVDTLLDERFDELVRVLGRLPDADDPLEIIRARARAFMRFGLSNPIHYRLLTVAREPDAELPPSAEAARNFLQKPWDELAAEGRLRITDIEAAQRALWVTLHGLLSLHASRPDLEWPRPIFDETIDAMLRGLVAEEKPARQRSRPRRPRSPQ